MKRRSTMKLAATLLVLGATQWALLGDAFAAITAKANHDHIAIDFSYHGSTVTVRGESEAGVDLVVKITSPDGHQTMNRKGKVAAILWMNVGSLTFAKAPNLYEVFSTRKLDEILSPEERAAHVIGYDALEAHVEIDPAGSAQEKAKWFREFVAFKESSKLYTVGSEPIETKRLANGRQQYMLSTRWAHQAPPGEYTVAVYAIEEGRVSETAECKVHVEQTGIVKTLASMARDSAALYAILSIGIALSAGFGVSMVLRKGGGAH
jgi:uncharacterized protein (TIGR02186 family)